MHILLLPSFYPSSRRPVTGIFFHEQAAALHKRGHRVGVLVTPRLNFTLDHVRAGLPARIPDLFGTSREPEYTDFPVYRMHWGWFPRPLPPIVAPLVAAAGLRAYDAYVRAHGRPDVIHAHNIFYGGHVAAQIKARRGVPVVLTEHSTSYMENLIIFPGQPRIIQQTLARIDTVLAVGATLAGAMHQYAPDTHIDIIGNIVDVDRFMPTSQTLALDPFMISAVGTLEKRKDFPTLIAAFAHAFAGTSAQLSIAGEGHERPAIEALIRQLGMIEQVSLHGRLTRDGVRDLLRQSHVLVSSSLVESFGVTLIEAMACGVPVVSTRSGGPDDFVTDDNGILVPIRDVEALAAALRAMRQNYASYDRARIRALCVERFSEAAIMTTLESIYARVV